MVKIEPYLDVVLQPNCVQRGICREGIHSCRYTVTDDFEAKRKRLVMATMDMLNGRKL